MEIKIQVSREKIGKRWLSFMEVGGEKYEILGFSADRMPLIMKHVASYKFFLVHVKNKTVLDVGCGYGYGTFLLSRVCKTVVGIDLSPERIRKAKETYRADNIDFQVMDAMLIEKHFEPNNFEVVTAMQFIEHIPEPQNFLDSVKTVLTERGRFILATPNRLFRLGNSNIPWNPEHFQEYDAKSLDQLLSTCFRNINIYGIYGIPEAYEWERRRMGGNISPRMKSIWRYTPEWLKKSLRRVVNLNLKEIDVTVDDYVVKDSVDSSSFFLLASCTKRS